MHNVLNECIMFLTRERQMTDFIADKDGSFSKTKKDERVFVAASGLVQPGDVIHTLLWPWSDDRAQRRLHPSKRKQMFGPPAITKTDVVLRVGKSFKRDGDKEEKQYAYIETIFSSY